MILDGIEIIDFKNIPDATIEFSPGVNCLLGQNGMGKSNLLEAIHFLSFVRPVSSIPDSTLIRRGSEFLMVKGHYTTDSGASIKVSCGVTRGKGKSLKLDGKEYQRLSEHIGRIPVVIVAPSDTRLVEGGADERRRLMDMVISQANQSYLANLMRYNRSVDSRNRMLRSGMKDPLLYESVEQTMQLTSDVVFKARKEWAHTIAPIFQQYYTAISGETEQARIQYKSQLDEADLTALLAESRTKDLALGYTSRGIHRDDLEMTINGFSARRLGSQGQVKTFTIALRLAIFDYLRRIRGVVPLLLLDDIFDKLDATRVGRIMKLVSENRTFGQIFITDTNRKHLDEILREINGPRLLLSVSDGTFSIIENSTGQ